MGVECTGVAIGVKCEDQFAQRPVKVDATRRHAPKRAAEFDDDPSKLPLPLVEHLGVVTVRPPRATEEFIPGRVVCPLDQLAKALGALGADREVRHYAPFPDSIAITRWLRARTT